MNAPVTMPTTDLVWQHVTDSAQWDRELAALGGHPLQSALWGDARRLADGIEDVRFLGTLADGTRSMIRIELRRIPFIGGVVGWAPRGPAGAALDSAQLCALARLVEPTLHLIVTDPWQEWIGGTSGVETIWVDLTSGSESLWKSFDKRFRASVRKAKREGVVVRESGAPEDQSEFFSLMRRIGEQKDFSLSISPSLISHLLGQPPADISAHLFLAEFKDRLAAAALIVKCSASLHYISGGTERALSKQQPGEALQWSVIEWAIGRGATRYDLEGIDRQKNPGTYAFKKKLGGREVILAGKSYHPVSRIGAVLAVLDGWRDRFSRGR